MLAAAGMQVMDLRCRGVAVAAVQLRGSDGCVAAAHAQRRADRRRLIGFGCWESISTEPSSSSTESELVLCFVYIYIAVPRSPPLPTQIKTAIQFHKSALENLLFHTIYKFNTKIR